METRRSACILSVMTAWAVLVCGVPAPQAATRPPAVHPGPEASRATMPPAVLADRDGDRLSDRLQARLAQGQPADRYEVVVTFSAPAHAAAARKAVGAFAPAREFTLVPGFAATLSAAQIQGLARARGVLRVEEDFVVRTMLDAARDDFGVSVAQDVFRYDGAGVGICVIDTGVDPGHEQLDGGKVVAFRDIVAGQTNPYDDHGHGTHVSSIAAGDGTGGPSAPRYRGVAPGASIYAVKVLDALGQGSESGVIAGVEWCVAQPGVDVLSMSLGSSVPSDGGDALSLAVDSAVAMGKVVVVAAGNSGDGPSSVGSPGAAARAITVGAAAEWSAPAPAANHSDGIYLAPFSSRGPTVDGRAKPDLLAPGVSVTAARAGSPAGYATWSGTSMATPFVAGTAALAVQASAGLATPDVIKGRLLQSAHRHFAAADNDWGGGLVDATALMRSLDESLPVPATDFPRLRRESLAVPKGGVGEYAFEIGADDLNAPVAVGITIVDGEQVCLYGIPFVCDLLGGWAWTPDYDAELIRVSGGVETVVAGSICPLEGECGAAGRQETLHFLPTAVSELGTYLVRVWQFPDDPGGMRAGTVLLDLSTGPVSGNLPPVAYAGGDYGGAEDVPIAFDGTASTDPDGDALSYRWEFGDGALGTGPTPSHAYSAGGSYTVTLVVNDGHSDSPPDTAEVTVTEVNDAPVAVIGPVPASVGTGETVPFDGGGSYDIDDVIVSYAWDFGDGSGGTGVSPTHAYAGAGNYAVTLTVTDAGGLTGTATAGIAVVATPPTASSVHIGDLDGSAVASRKFWSATVSVAVHDGSHAPVAGALVTGNGGVANCTTGSDGRCTVSFRKLSNKTSSIVFTVFAVADVVGGAPYDAAENHDDDGSSDGTSITVDRP